MDPQSGSAARVGFVVFIALLLVMAGVYFVGDGGSLFVGHVKYRTRFPTTMGLRTNAPVWLAGEEVGRVTDISFSEDLDPPLVQVTVSVKSRFQKRIREDSFAWIQTQGLLGDKLVSIKMGHPARPQLPEGSVIPAKDISLIREIVGEDLVSGTGDLLNNLIALLKEINSGQGTVGHLLKNPELYHNLNTFTSSLSTVTAELAVIARDMKEVIGGIREQKGILGKALLSEEYAREVTESVLSARRLLASMEKVMEPIVKGEGTFGKLLRDEELYRSLKEAGTRTASAAERLDGVLRDLKGNQSVLGRALADRELGERFARLVANLDQGTATLGRILAKVDGGEGSVGMLVHDPSIAVAIRDVFLGVRESDLLLNVARRAEETGRAIRFRDERINRRMSEKEMERSRRAGQGEDSQALPAISKEKEQGPPIPAPAPAPEEPGKPDR